MDPPNFGKCRYACMCKFRVSGVPCDLQEVAEKYCKVYKTFQKFEVEDHGHALTA
jgi:hypothetical protein